MKSNFFEKIKNTNYPYIIAELGSNHNGDMDIAKKLISSAKQSGADCVKFQSWSKETIFSRKTYDDNYFVADDYRNRTDYTLEEIVEKFAISPDELLSMKKFSDNENIECTSTPFSRPETDFLVEKLNTGFIKTASMDLNNYPFLEYVAGKGLPIVLSTGLSNFYEIDKAVRTIENAGNNEIIILHCVAVYPPKDMEVNLNRIKTLQQVYPDYPIGFSDHTLGTSIPLAAVALGAKLIEKHYTLDKNMFGWDHKVSATPDEMSVIVTESKRIVDALGTGRILRVEDDERINSFRRSLVASRDIAEGERIENSDIEFKRPGTGIQPDEYQFVIGRKCKNSIKQDQLISWEDLD